MRVRTGDPEMAREYNKALILDLFRKHSAISRAQIARQLSLSKMTVSAIIRELIDDDLVNELGEGKSYEMGGRKPIILSLNGNSKYVVGIDIGASTIVTTIGNLKGEVIKKKKSPTSNNLSINNIINQSVSLIDKTIDASTIRKNKITGLGVSVAGIVERDKGLIISSPDFNWENIYITKLFEERTGLKTVVDNCTRVLTLAEKWYGGARNVKNLFFIGLGFGLGSAMIIDNKIYGNHSEFGHIFVKKTEVRCFCGKYGCLEAISSGHAIALMAAKRMNGKNKNKLTAEKVAELAKQKNPIAKKIFNDAGKYLGRSISIAANIFNPEKIIIGGGVTLVGDLVLDPIIKEYEKHIMDAIKPGIKIELSSLGKDAGGLGTIALALNEFIFRPDVINLYS